MTYERPYHCLSLDEWITVTSVLTYSEVKVFYYLLASNPMGDRQIDCRIRTIAKALNISTGAVSTALKQLEVKKLIESVEIVEARITIKPKLISVQAQKYKDKADKAKNKKKTVQPTEQNVQPTEQNVQPTEQNVQPTEQNVQPTEQVKLPEPISVNAFDDFNSHQTIQTYSDFKKTLSEKERESFEKFVREEYFRIEGKKIRSFTAFMSDDHFQEWLTLWNNRPEAIKETQNVKWENHPYRDEWIAEIESSGNPLMFALRDKEKQEFVKWANENKIFSWFKEEEQ